MTADTTPVDTAPLDDATIDLDGDQLIELTSIVSPEDAQAVLADLTVSVRRELDEIRVLLDDD